MRGALALVAVLCSGHPLRAVEVRTYDGNDFVTWDHPRGLVNVSAEGLAARQFGGAYNAASDIAEYGARVVGVHGTRTLRTQSNEPDIGTVIDQDAHTWWKPELADPVESWWFELDLGRAVVATKIRLVFADTVGARPFEFFSVYVSRGIGLRLSPGQVRFDRVGRPFNGNTSRVVELDLQIVDPAAATAPYLAMEDTLDFDIIRFVRFEATGKTPDAALAEIEVETVGFNLSTRVTTENRLEDGMEVWGGQAWTSNVRDCPACGKAIGADGLVDGDLGGRYWSIEAAQNDDWRAWGHWSVIDLGHVFRVERLVWVPVIASVSPFLYGYEQWRQGGWTLTDFLVSDGTPSSLSDPEVEGPYEYEMLTSIDNVDTPPRNFYDFQFPPRDTRLILWRRMELSGSWAKALQLFIFPAEGYPAEVSLESPDMDLGGAFSVRRVEWDADVLPNTRIEVRTQTGNGYQTVTRYLLKNGVEVTKADYEAAKSRNRGDIIEDEIRDPSWSSWSRPHVVSGQAFQSPTPRRWVKVHVTLGSTDADVMSVLRSLSFIMNSPVISSGLAGELSPRTAALDSLQEFTYTITPNDDDPGDAGFDRVVVMVPPEATDAQLMRATVGGSEVDATAELRGDSLVVALPPPVVRGDSVEVIFRSRVFRSPTVFDVFVGNSVQEDNLQGVSPAELGLDQVYIPEVVDAASLFRNIDHTEVFTPNGDGTNDQYRLAFNVIKVDVAEASGAPRVRVYSLDGRQVAELESATPITGRAEYIWDGRDLKGATVPPGVYIVHLRIDTDAVDEVAQRLVNVVY